MIRQHLYRGWDGEKMLPPEDLTQSPKYRKWLGHVDVELMQFTGLRDAAGVQVFDGDCFWWDEEGDNSVLVVAFKNQMAGRGEQVAQFAYELYGHSIYVNEGGGEEYGRFKHLQDLHLDELYIERMRVIGNRFENPEFLEGTS